MYLIRQVTADPKQRQQLILADGSQLELVLYYRPLQQGWFIEELTYKDFTLRSVRVTNHPNMLHQFSNRIPFGLACSTQAQREPSLQEDFSSGVSKLFVLSRAEVLAYAEYLRGG